MRRAKKQGRRLPWSHRNPEKAPFPFEAPFHAAEVAHEVFQAWLTCPVFDAERPELWRSEAMKQVSRAALGMAGAGVDDVSHLDLYSCFASSVLFARDALGFKDGAYDRPLTVTGGLPFSGGAGSDYMTHSIATMADRLRKDPGSFGIVRRLGMHMTKHQHAAYSYERPP